MKRFLISSECTAHVLKKKRKEEEEKTLGKISLSNLLVVSNNNKLKYETVTLMEHNYR